VDIIRKAYRDPVAKAANKQGFRPGQSGNPKGRPQGSRNKATIAALAALEGDLQAITEKLLDAAKDGQPWAVKMVIDRLIPPARDLPVSFKLGRDGDLKAVMENILGDTARGKLTPSEALTVSQVVATLGLAQALEDLEAKVIKLQGAKR
jgi:hypothetical protein